MEAAQARVQNAVDSHSKELEQGLIRGIEGDMYRCNAKCCDQSLSMEDKERCIEQCTTRVMQIQKYIQYEMETFQNRLQRCGMDCQDRVRDSKSASPNEGEVDRLRKDFEKCVIKCADTHVDMVGPMFKRMWKSISNNTFS